MSQEEEYEESICELDTTLSNAILGQLRDNTLNWDEEGKRELTIKFGTFWIEAAKELEAIKRIIAKERGLTNRETNDLLRSTWPFEELEFM